MSLITVPIKESKKDGVIGLFSGIGKGLGSGVVKTLTGVFDVISDSCYSIKELSSLYRVSYNRLFPPRIYDDNKNILYLNSYNIELFEIMNLLGFPYGYKGISQYNGDIIIPDLSNRIYKTHILFYNILSILLLTENDLYFISYSDNPINPYNFIIEWSLSLSINDYKNYYLFMNNYQKIFHSQILMSLNVDVISF